VKRYEGQTFHALHNRRFGPRTKAGFALRDCFFDNCGLFPAFSPRWRFVIRDGILTGCRQHASRLATAAVEDVFVDGLRNVGDTFLFTWATVFKHVTLKGKIGALKLNQNVRGDVSARKQRAWDVSSRAYYRSVDWALDLSEAVFWSAPDLHAIPGALIRRDPETQVLVTREQAHTALAAGLPWGHSGLRVALTWFMEDGLYDDVVLVAAKSATYFREDLALLQLLRREQLAE
jgi:hypothetical protein